MKKHILVSFSSRQRNVVVDVAYSIEMLGDIQMITCTVTRNEHNAWLELYRFDYKSVKEGKKYTQLFYDNRNVKNVETALFIDKTYECIMEQEDCVLA